jgi:hypothetical protein
MKDNYFKLTTAGNNNSGKNKLFRETNFLNI